MRNWLMDAQQIHMETLKKLAKITNDYLNGKGAFPRLNVTDKLLGAMTAVNDELIEMQGIAVKAQEVMK